MEEAPGAREGECIIPHDALTPFKDTRWLPALFLFSPLTTTDKDCIIAASSTFTLSSGSLAPCLLLWSATVSNTDLYLASCVSCSKQLTRQMSTKQVCHDEGCWEKCNVPLALLANLHMGVVAFPAPFIYSCKAQNKEIDSFWNHHFQLIMALLLIIDNTCLLSISSSSYKVINCQFSWITHYWKAPPLLHTHTGTVTIVLVKVSSLTLTLNQQEHLLFLTLYNSFSGTLPISLPLTLSLSVHLYMFVWVCVCVVVDTTCAYVCRCLYFACMLAGNAH